MEKLFTIMVLGLLFGGNAYADLVMFDRCWETSENKDFKDSIKEGTFDNRMYEINTEKGTVVRIVVWSDEWVRKVKEMQNNNVDIGAIKVDQDSFRIKASSSMYVSTHPLTLRDSQASQEYVFHLKSGKAEQTTRGPFTYTQTYKCDKVSSK